MVNQSTRKVDNLTVDTTNTSYKSNLGTPKTASSTPGSTYAAIRGQSDIRSPGISKTPSTDQRYKFNNQDDTNVLHEDEVNITADVEQAPIPDFITQTDKYGNASTPRTESAIQVKSQDGGIAVSDTSDTDETDPSDKEDSVQLDACDTLLESLRMMCCCLLPDSHDVTATSSTTSRKVQQRQVDNEKHLQITRHGYGDTATYGRIDSNKSTFIETAEIKLLPNIIPADVGKKCLVLDLDETLVHSSFRAVPGADFVIPVQIEEVVHYVYVAKRPGVDEFLLEMAKHYEIILYTASLNKYADPLLDLLDPHRTIRTRLFRESCVYYEGNYVKDLSILDRDLSTTIIVDNSPSSYIFHPENAIDCSSFIDDPCDRELDQIGSFLKGVKDVKDVRSICSMWKEWPSIPKIANVEYPFEDLESREGELLQ